MTTETLPETTEQEVIQPEVELTQAEEPTPTEPVESPDPSDEIDAYFKERGLDDEAETVTPAEDESEAKEEAWLDELSPEHKEKVEALLKQDREAKESQKRATDAGRLQNFRNYRAWAMAQARADGSSEEFITRLGNSINQYHDQSLQFANQQVGEENRQALYVMLAGYLKPDDRQDFLEKKAAEPEAFTADFVKRVREGYVPESAVKKAAAKEVKDYQEFLLAKPERIEALASRAKAPAGNSSGANGTGLGASTKAKARTLHAQGKITDAQMRAIRDNPNIPDGY